MGGSQSIAATYTKQITRQDLLKSTENNRDFMNKLFQLMIGQITPEDILKLSKQSLCSQYVFMMADTIHSLFDDLRIRPKTDKTSGVVLFKKVDNLKKETKQTREICLTIAYFYVRIFQIFSALAVTVLDDPGAGAVLGAVQYAEQQPGKKLFGALGLTEKRIPGSRPAVAQFGGASMQFFLGEAAKQFAPIHTMFEEGKLEQGRVILPLRDYGDIVEIIPGRISNRNRKPQNMRITLPDNSTLYGNIAAYRAGSTDSLPKYRLTINNFESHNSSISALVAINMQISKFQESFEIGSFDGGQTWITQSGNAQDKVWMIIEKVYQIIQKLTENPALTLDKLKTVQQQVQKREEQAPGVAAARQAYPTTEIGVPKELMNEYLIKTLKGITEQKTISFCVARALQLLNADALFMRNPTQAQSSICRLKFAQFPSSVPQIGESLDKVTGLKVLDQLFHTQPFLTEKEETRISVDDPASYAEFLQNMTRLFGTQAATKITSVDKIVARQQDGCASVSASKMYLGITDKAAIQKIKGIVQTMFYRQFVHTQQVIQFIRSRLFVVRKIKGPSGAPVSAYDIHPRLLQGGLDELTLLSKDARNILVKYYTDCEDLYQKGALEILRSRPNVIQGQ